MTLPDTLSPGLRRFLTEAGPKDVLDAIVVFADPDGADERRAPVRRASASSKKRAASRIAASRAGLEQTAHDECLKSFGPAGKSLADGDLDFSFSRQLGVANVTLSRQALARLAHEKHVAAIMPNQRVHPIRPTEVDYGALGRTEKKKGITWGLDFLGVPDLWSHSRGEGVTVAVLDTGVHADHPDLRKKVRHFRVFDPLGRSIEATPFFDCDGHGTHVCGTIAGGDASGVAIGVAPEAKLVVGAPLVGRASLRTLVAAMAWAVDVGADIVNMSLGFDYYEPNFELILQRLVYDYGVLPVVSIGNENHGNTSCPGSCSSALSVGALEKLPRGKHKVAEFSSGASLVFPGQQPDRVDKPDVVAPGVQVWSAIPPEQQGGKTHSHLYMGGTSMATPHVSGVAALLMSARPSAPVTAVAEAIKQTARHPEGDGARPDNRYGWGIIRPADALAAL
ncbi:S8 family serine peptidase [bacterium]|nr:S8 family serine peptidase [bacterium]